MPDDNVNVDPANGGDNTPNNPQPSPSGPERFTLTQEELNAKFADHKRGMQRELAEARKKAQAFEALQGQVSDLLESGLIDGVEDLDDFRDAAAQTLHSFQSEKEQYEANQKQMAKKLEQATQEAAQSRQRYEHALIQRAITDDAADMVVDGPGREGAIEFFQLKLGQIAQVKDDVVQVEWEVTDEETGRTEKRFVPVKDVLKSMESNPTKYGRYFKSTVNGGDGGETVDGVKRTDDGSIDFANMDFNKFKELKQKNPQLLNDAAAKLVF